MHPPICSVEFSSLLLLRQQTAPVGGSVSREGKLALLFIWRGDSTQDIKEPSWEGSRSKRG